MPPIAYVLASDSVMDGLRVCGTGSRAAAD
jgi:hypothetical protein